ncbi:ATPase [Elasticomyces elasticus]|nr:ATPase [Elasticomyces elasticus]
MSEYRDQQYNHGGPLREYDKRVRAGRLRNDEHQRTLVQALQDLHDHLMKYNPDKVVEPTIESLQPKKKSFLSIGGGSAWLDVSTCCRLAYRKSGLGPLA